MKTIQVRPETDDDADFHQVAVRLRRSKRKMPAMLSWRHPFFGRGRCARFVAIRGGAPVARVGASLDPLMLVDGEQVGCLAHFESADDGDAASNVIGAAMDWLRSRGCRRAVGPMDYSTWHRYRFSVEGARDEPFFLEPTQPQHYPRIFEAAGLHEAFHYSSHVVEPPNIGDDEPLRAEGWTVRRASRLHSADELRLLYSLSMQVFAKNRFFVPIGWAEFTQLYGRLRWLMDPDFLLFAHGPDGRAAGFVFALPDLGAMNPARTGWREVSRMASRMRKHDTLVVKTLGVLPAWRRAGIGGLLLRQLQRNARARGFRRYIHALMADDNVSTGMGRGTVTPLRRYALYERRL